MNSRSFLFAGGFCLACVIVLGSAAMQLAVGDSHVHRQNDPEYQISAEAQAEKENTDPEQSIREALSKRRKLEALLRHAEALMEINFVAEDSLTAAGRIPLSDEVVALFAEMVQVIDESPGYRFEVVVSDPDSGTSLRRAETIRSALLLTLRHPSRLRITENLSNRPQLTVRAVETPSSS